MSKTVCVMSKPSRECRNPVGVDGGGGLLLPRVGPPHRSDCGGPTLGYALKSLRDTSKGLNAYSWFGRLFAALAPAGVALFRVRKLFRREFVLAQLNFLLDAICNRT